MEEKPSIGYAEGPLCFETYEVGPIRSEDIFFLLENAPETESATFFGMRFLAELGTIPGSSADLTIDLKRKGLGLKNSFIPSPKNRSQFEATLDGGKLEKLSLDYPDFHGKKEDFWNAGKALKIVGWNLKRFQRNDYSLDPSSLKLSHYLVETPNRFAPAFFCNYLGRINLRTKEMVKGGSKRKLVLTFTHDLADSDEVRAYRELLDSIDSRSK
jgi:hypothetical protein